MKSPAYPVKSILLVLLSGLFHCAFAQKINSVQEGSFNAPAGIKIDGKLNEWSTLQAYNKTTRVWYTIANDENDIYLAIKSTDANNINKILANGISFTVNTADKKKDKDAFIITYPVATNGNKGQGRGRHGFGQQGEAPDSAEILAQHKQSLAACKVISAIGFKDITDTLISIYNEYSIKAVANFDDKGNYAYELAIPLKLLNITADNKTEIAYHLKVNGMQNGGPIMAMGSVKLSGGGGFGGGGDGFRSRDDSDANDMISPTDFWGKYVLIPNKVPGN